MSYDLAETAQVPLVVLADFSERLCRQGTAKAAVARLSKEARRCRHRTVAAREPWRPPAAAEFDFSGVEVSTNGLRSLINYTRRLAWDHAGLSSADPL